MAYAISLVPADAGLHTVILASSIVLALAAVLTLVHLPRPRAAAWAEAASWTDNAAGVWSSRPPPSLLGAAWASGTAVAAELGPFDSPYQSAAQTAAEHTALEPGRFLLARAGRTGGHRPGRPQRRDGRDVSTGQRGRLGHRARIPPCWRFHRSGAGDLSEPVRADVRSGRVEDVLVSMAPRTRNPAMRWVGAHCHGGNLVHQGGATYRRYVCLPADVSP